MCLGGADSSTALFRPVAVRGIWLAGVLERGPVQRMMRGSSLSCLASLLSTLALAYFLSEVEIWCVTYLALAGSGYKNCSCEIF